MKYQLKYDKKEYNFYDLLSNDNGKPGENLTLKILRITKNTTQIYYQD